MKLFAFHFAFRKAWIHLFSLHLAIGKCLSRLGYLTLVRQPVLEKENSVFKSVKLWSKIDLMSQPAFGYK